MYPQQSEFESLDYSSIPTDKFNVTVGKTAGSKYLCRRIRNSLAHAQFQMSNGFFRFEDGNPCGGDKFKAEIEIILEHANIIIPLSKRYLSQKDLDEIREDKISRGEDPDE